MHQQNDVTSAPPEGAPTPERGRVLEQIEHDFGDGCVFVQIVLPGASSSDVARDKRMARELHRRIRLQEPPPASSRSRQPQSVRPRSRASRRARSRSPGRLADDPEPEPPLAPLTAPERLTLKQLVDRARRAAVLPRDEWRLCAKCLREQEPEEFSRDATYCRSCERERLKVYRQSRQAVAA